MRAKNDILYDYLALINEEKNLGYSADEIKEKISNKLERVSIEKLLLEELYSCEKIMGQDIFTERAFYVFCNAVVRYDYKTGGEIWNDFVYRQFLMVERNRFTCYMAPRGHGKTFFLGLYVVFKMFLIEYFEVAYCTNTPKQRKKFLRLVRNIVDTNELLLEKKDKTRIAQKEISWGTEELEFNHGVLEGTTVGTTPRGGHYNLAIGDDALRDDKKYTYEFIIDYFQGILRPTIYRFKGRYIIVGTPQDPDDLFHTLMNSKLDKTNRPLGRLVEEAVSAAGFYSKTFDAIIDDKTQEVLMPIMWTYADLMDERDRIGDMRFNREMRCRCTSFRNALIGSKLFRDCSDPKRCMRQVGERGKKYVIFADSASSDAPTADYCAISVWEDDVENDKFIFTCLFHERGYPIIDPEGGSGDQPHVVVQFHNDFNKALVVVEKNNAGIALSQAVQAMGVEVVEHYTHMNANPGLKEGKVNDVVNYVEAMKKGTIVFPCDPDDHFTVDLYEKIKTEHLNFGVKKGKTGEKYEALAGKDDIFDASWGAFKFRGDAVDTLPFGITVAGNG